MPSDPIPDFPAAVSEIDVELRRQAAHGTLSAGSARALRGDLAHFAGWCAEVGRLAMPASPATVAAFVTVMAAVRAPATVRRYLSSIASIHRVAEVPNPCDGLVVKRALRRMDRARGRDQQRAAPISDALVARMLAAAGTGIRDLRNKALLVVAYSTMARPGELTALRIEDLEIDADGVGTIAIRRGETDQEIPGPTAATVAPDAVRHLQAWLDAAGIKNGLLFRAVLKGGRIGGGLDPRDVSRLFKAMARGAGLSETETARISGHSTRVGGAQDMVRYGQSLQAIMEAGRWKSPEMVDRYTAKPDLRHSAVLGLAERRVRF
jgi:integrase